MIKTETISISVNNMNYKHYLNLGYCVLTTEGKVAKKKIIDVKVEHVIGGNHKVVAVCDNCKKEFSVLIGTINKQLKNKKTCFCKNCQASMNAIKRVKIHNFGGKNVLQKVETDKKCYGGCGQKAQYKSKAGKYWCTETGGFTCPGSHQKGVETFKKNGCNIGEKNGMFGTTLSDERKKFNSEWMKENISKGKFTPNVTNSWANSKTFLQIDGCKYYFRSSWEAIFWLKNKNYEYEKIRIPYKNVDGKKKNYIVDFVDETEKKLYEIKPSSEKNKKQNMLKTEAAKQWSKIHGYEYQIISENWFKENLTENNVIEFSTYGEKIKKGLKSLLK